MRILNAEKDDMKNKFQMIFILVSVLGLAAWLSTACAPNNNPSSYGSGTATPTPVNAQTIWANGNFGSFFGASVAPVTVNGSILNVNTPDPISGDTTTLQFSATAVTTPLAPYFLDSAPENPGTYYASGHLQFDIILDQSPLSGNITVGFGYVNSGGSTVTTSYALPVTSLNNSTFTHESIPLSKFTNSASVVEPFFVVGPNGNAEAQFTMDNIQWTSN
jgi:hypothetical protein